MADNFLPEEAIWEDGIRQIETTDTVLGGSGGTPNIAPKQLANRTLYLKQKMEANLLSMVGLIGEFHNAGPLAGWVDLKGGELSRTTDKLLWDYAVAAGMTVAQATKDADPMAHAMKFGDGDGATTFTLPNHHLGHFVRGTPSGKSHGQTQNDAMRRIVGSVSTNNGWMFTGGSGDMKVLGSPSVQRNATDALNPSSVHASIGIDTALTQPTDTEIRPYTANLSIKIHRGWM